MKLEPSVMTDFILNGSASGTTAQRMAISGWNSQQFRPFIPKGYGLDGPQYINNKKGGVSRVIANDATLTYDQWKQIDDEVLKVQRLDLGAWDEFDMRGLNYGLDGGWKKTLLLTQAMSDPGEAQISIDGITRGRTDRPVRDEVLLPIPCISSDFQFTLREMDEAAGSGMPLDTTNIEACTRRVMEIREKLTTGTYGTYTFGGGTIYGLTNYPQRLTGSLDDPAGGTWTPEKTVKNVLTMRQALINQAFTGPFMLFTGLGWEPYLEVDYSAAKGDNSLRQRIMAINKLSGVKTLNFLPSMAMVMVSMTKQTVRMITGMGLKVIRWESQGGLEVNFKVLWCGAPQMRKTKTNQCGIAHYTV